MKPGGGQAQLPVIHDFNENLESDLASESEEDPRTDIQEPGCLSNYERKVFGSENVTI